MVQNKGLKTPQEYQLWVVPHRQIGRAVKASDLKSDEFYSRRFESCICRMKYISIKAILT